MRVMMFQFLTLCTVTLLLLTGCNKKTDNETGEASEGTPEYAAVAFAQALYNDSDMDEALALSTDRMRRILSSYHTTRNAQRHVMNLKYDKVEIKPDGGNRIGRMQFAEKATITLFFSGSYNDERVEDLRNIHLLRQGGQWKIDRVSNDYM
ncbi:hypothetical protein [Salinimonas iocasae]|uniref:Lipoprotein n=1 Tax=Salinimonas iocasae TaxID=2572577 RepID=A0A5B7YEL0_9ALTE|nr:hypothetical protein [Salinimonas iocasae]QCZ93663.1 hypothetical protein FBQ74_09225 [Salinimonas iocasae]